MDEEDGEEDTNIYARAREEDGENGDPVIDREERSEEIRKGFRRAFRRTPYPGELEQLVTESWQRGLKPVMVSIALEKASLYEPGSPVNYVLQMFRDWRYHEVWLPHHVDEYQEEFRQLGGIGGPYDREHWEEAKRRRRLEHRIDELDDPDLPY